MYIYPAVWWVKILLILCQQFNCYERFRGLCGNDKATFCSFTIFGVECSLTTVTVSGSLYRWMSILLNLSSSRALGVRACLSHKEENPNISFGTADRQWKISEQIIFPTSCMCSEEPWAATPFTVKSFRQFLCCLYVQHIQTEAQFHPLTVTFIWFVPRIS